MSGVTRKKLIEVALPLEAINQASAREKSIRHGHPSTLHPWWSRKPLATCRAVLFASLVDDPSSLPEQFPTEEAQEQERQRLFRIIEELVKWENSTNEPVLEAARAEIMRSTGGNPPPVYDPFCGGGSIPLEAQRLGLEAHASDLNPVAVLITKALVEIPYKFIGRRPVNPEARSKIGHADGWQAAHGLAEDVRYYGRWLRDEAKRRVGDLYPRVLVPREHGGGEATIIAWLWARTVRCPNPACGIQMPLVSKWWLSTKAGKRAWVEPVVDRIAKTVCINVCTGSGEPQEGTVNRRGATCICCHTPVPFEHVRQEARAGRMGAQLLAIVADGQRGRIYLPPVSVSDSVEVIPANVPETELPEQALGFRVQLYGMTLHRDLFTPRQLVVLTTFGDLVCEARERAWEDAVAAGVLDDGVPLNDCGQGATAYADAIATYLGLGASKVTDYNSSLVTWSQGRDQAKATFARQALPMVWDYCEVNPFADAAGDLSVTFRGLAEALERSTPSTVPVAAHQQDAMTAPSQTGYCISTDPPYYDNIGYSDLSDFFYVWLRRSMAHVYPDLFSTLLVPKAQELVATPYRFGGDRDEARRSFEEGLGRSFHCMREAQSADYPLTIYYAFKQAEGDDEDEDGVSSTASTGWETMLEGLLQAQFTITGTWPMRSERSARSVANGTNALASSIVLVCRPRPGDAPSATRREFLSALKRELPDALQKLQHGNIAPVDLAQAAVGPGMAVFSRCSCVPEADGRRMSVRTALALINQTLDEVLAQQEGEFDADTRWALAWFEQYAMDEGPFGVAETLSKAKNTAVSGLTEAGLLRAKAGKVRLLKRDELPADWDPGTQGQTNVWAVTQHLIRALEKDGEEGAKTLLRRAGGAGEAARDLAYRLYSICERKKWAQEALAYNSLVIAWPEITRLAASAEPIEVQPALTLE